MVTFTGTQGLGLGYTWGGEGRSDTILLTQVGSRIVCTEQETVSYLEILGNTWQGVFSYLGWGWVGIGDTVCGGFFFFFCFLVLHPGHMEVPRLGVESELQMPAYATDSKARSELRLRSTLQLTAMLDT